MTAFSLGTAALISFSAMATNNRVLQPVLLFRVGNYPDKCPTPITEADLDTIVANFSGECPVKLEHIETAIDPLGHVATLYREGGELFGVLAFSSGVYAHIKDRNANKVSVTLERLADGGLRMKDTCLVIEPRVAGAGFLPPVAVSQKVAHFSAQGKLTPATAPLAARILSAPQELKFSDGSSGSPVADFEAFLEALPVVQPRGAGVPLQFSAPGDGLTDAERDMAKLFGNDPAKVAAIKKEGKR